MPNIIVTNIDGERSEIETQAGDILMEVLSDNDFDEIEGVCGGICSCATCHIYIKPEWSNKLPVKKAEEEDLVSGLDAYQDNSRLSCQIVLSDDLHGLELTIAPMED